MPKKKEQEKVGFFKKWYTYQKERFPVLMFLLYTFCIALGAFFVINCYVEIMNLSPLTKGLDFSIELIPSGRFYKYGLRDDNGIEISFNQKNTIIPIAVMTICGFLQFLMVRIIDEFKDYEEDCKYRSYRPVPRGLVSLKELKILFAISFILQIILTYIFKGDFVALAILWVVFGLMTKGFFIKSFLDKHQLVELILDELMMPAMVLYIASFGVGKVQMSGSWSIWNIFLHPEGNDWIVLVLFLLMSYFCSCIAEVARKVRSKDKEEKGVKTYTAVFGIPKATLLLSLVETGVLLCQLFILGYDNLSYVFPIYTFCIVFNIIFNYRSEHKYSKLVELSGNLYIVFAYLSMLLLYK